MQQIKQWKIIILTLTGNKMCDTRNNQTKGDTGLKLLYTPEKNLTLMKQIRNKKLF